MKFAVLFACLLGASALEKPIKPQPVNVTNSNPVTKVVELLTTLKGQIQEDGKKEQQMYDKTACWCEKATKAKADAIERAQKQMRALAQEIMKLKAKIATLTSEIAELAQQIKENEEAQAEATQIRQKENADYQVESSEIKMAMSALTAAIKVLLKGTAKEAIFLRTDSGNMALRNVLSKLPKRLNIDDEKLSFLQDLVENGAKYQPQSLTVQGILTNMYDTFAVDLETLTSDEATKNRDFEDFIATKQQELIELQSVKARKEKQKAHAEASLAEATDMYDKTEAQMKADIAFFDETKAYCLQVNELWTARSDERQQELSGIEEAVAILTNEACSNTDNGASDSYGDDCAEYDDGHPSWCGNYEDSDFTSTTMCCLCGGGFSEAREIFSLSIKAGKEVRTGDYDTGVDISSFLQINSDSEAPAMRAYSILKAQAVRAHSLRLAQLAATVRTSKVGHFDKVLAAIDEMIETLKTEDKSDIAKRNQCKEEYQKINSTVADLNWKMKNNLATIDKLETLIAKREDAKLKTIEEISNVEANIKTMEDTRKEENQAFLAAKQGDTAAIDLLMKARDVLSMYYKENNVTMGPLQLLSESQAPVYEVSNMSRPEFDLSGKGSRKGQSKGILSIMTMIIEDLNDEIKNGMKAEEEAQMDFEKALKAAKDLKQSLEEKKTSLEEAIARRTEEMEDEHEKMSTNKYDLTDEVAYKASIRPDCDFIIGAFAERSAKRKAELNGLTEAKAFLSNGMLAQQGSLLQTKTQVPGKKTLADIKFLGLQN